MIDKSNIVFKGTLSTVDTERNCVGGWAYVSKKAGEVVTDHSGDTWSIEEVEKTAHQFVSDCRVGGESHTTTGGAELVESIVFSKALQDALGIDLGKEGWFVVFKVTDPDLLEKVQKGTLSMFSIGGSGVREEV